MGWTFNPFTGQLDKIVSTSTTAVWVRGSATISASTTQNMDTISNALFNSVKYKLSAVNDANNRYRSLEMDILNANGSYKDTITHRLRDGTISLAFNTVNNAGTMELQVTNNNAFDVEIEYAKLILVD